MSNDTDPPRPRWWADPAHQNLREQITEIERMGKQIEEAAHGTDIDKLSCLLDYGAFTIEQVAEHLGVSVPEAYERLAKQEPLKVKRLEPFSVPEERAHLVGTGLIPVVVLSRDEMKKRYPDGSDRDGTPLPTAQLGAMIRSDEAHGRPSRSAHRLPGRPVA